MHCVRGSPAVAALHLARWPMVDRETLSRAACLGIHPHRPQLRVQDKLPISTRRQPNRVPGGPSLRVRPSSPLRTGLRCIGRGRRSGGQHGRRALRRRVRRERAADRPPPPSGRELPRPGRCRRAAVPSVRPAHLSHQRRARRRISERLHGVAAVRAPGAGERRRPAGPDPDQPNDDQRTLWPRSRRSRGDGISGARRRTARRDPDVRRRDRRARRTRAATSASFAATRASIGAAIRPNSMPASAAAFRPARTPTTATSATAFS